MKLPALSKEQAQKALRIYFERARDSIPLPDPKPILLTKVVACDCATPCKVCKCQS